MREISQALGALISGKARGASQRYKIDRPLRVAILGPNLGNLSDLGSMKRRQIHDALVADGHKPFFPEDFVISEEPRDPLLEQERRILSGRDVDLVIILHTHNSFGALMEIANFVSVPDIRAKTAVLFPFDHYTPDYALPGNTIRAFRDRMLYSKEQLVSCQLVGECRKWAHDRATGQWPDPVPHSF